MKKPAPKPTAVVCTLCGLDWKAHEEKAAKMSAKRPAPAPTAETCVELLKAELARRPKFQQFPWQSSASGTNFNPYAGIPLRGNDVGKIQ